MWMIYPMFQIVTVITRKLSQEMKIMMMTYNIFTNIIDENSKKKKKSSSPSSASDESNSDWDDLEDIDKLLSQSIPPRLIALSRNLAASPLPSSTAPVMTRTARSVARKKTYLRVSGSKR